MAVSKMHADEVHTDADLVRRLLARQFPEWAALPIGRVPSSGTDNALYRVGGDKVARFPRVASAVPGSDREYEWLPRLAPLLPVAVPTPLARGEPAVGYPWKWAVYRWLDGRNPTIGRLADPNALAVDLARFVRALHRVEFPDPPPAFRGLDLARRDKRTRAAIAEAADELDTDPVIAEWENALATPGWSGAATWIHGDLLPGNLLVQRSRLSAVIDFSGVGIGDPACDLLPAWALLPAGARAVFRAELDVDDATWARGRWWALSIALIALPYYRETNPPFASLARHMIGEVVPRATRE